MGFVAAKCTQCGANIHVDDTKDAGICEYCGTAFITEKAIINYTNNITNHTNINADVVNVYDTKKDFIIRAGKLEEYNGEDMDVIIPSNVTVIGKNAFSKESWKHTNIDGSNIRKVFIPETVTKIEDRAFFKCKNLSTVIMTNEVSFIGSRCFYGCENLKTISITDSSDNPADNCFENVQEGVVQLPKVLKKIPSLMFFGCSNITNVVIPDGVTDIEQFSFNKMPNLFEITIPDSVINCHFEAFTTVIDKDNIRFVYASEEWKQKNSDKISCLAPETKTKNGCYIATCIYGSYDCPQVWTLRRYRDDTLDKTWYGKVFIKCYYAISPALVRRFGKTNWFRRFWKSRLDKAVMKLNRKGIDNTEYHDKY